MKSKIKNLIYFQNGSIGDFLMTIFFLENIHLNDNSIKLNVVVPKNEKLLQQFLEKYPYINLILANRRSLQGILGIFSLGRFVFSKNLVITAPTPGFLFSHIKIMAKLVALHSQSELIGFDDGRNINKYIYTKLLEYDTKIIYSDFLKKLIVGLGFEVKNEVPKLKYSPDKNILAELELEKENYVVLHAFGSSDKRSFKIEEIIKLIKKIKQISVNSKIVLTGGERDKDALDKLSLFFGGEIIILLNSECSKLCVIINNAKLFVSIDTGTAHLASFLQKKSLVVAHFATTPNWLPYYNPNANILYSVENCPHQIYEGREHLEKCRGERLIRLSAVPLEIIENYLEKILR